MPDQEPLHNGSHRALLHRATPPVANADRLDAIIVPTARTAPYLRESIRLARALRCVLLVLCSGMSRTRKVTALIASEGADLEFVVVDLPDSPPAKLPRFETCSMLEHTRFHRRTDTSRKRNIGLAIARMVGWRRVLFLDDDILIPDATDVRRVVGLLGRYDSVGLRIGGYPDNSVVCHAHRASGGFQDTFVGGGALAVSHRRYGSFFPNIYNEDWFFLLDEQGLPPVAEAGQAFQQPYDPFADPERARGQELGDDLAEGIFALLDGHGKIDDATLGYWRGFLRRRRALIADIIRRVDAMPVEDGERNRMIASLKAARGRAEHITAELCVEYINAWRRDTSAWSTMVDRLPSVGIAEALEVLGLHDHAVGLVAGPVLGQRGRTRLNGRARYVRRPVPAGS